MAKILINLHSKQTIPNYVAIKQINPDKVIALATPEFANQIALFEEVTKVKHVLNTIDAYDVEYNFRVIQEVVNELGTGNDIVVNYTGGTKIMSVSLVLKVLLSIKQPLLFAYVNTHDHKMEYLQLNEQKSLSAYSKPIIVNVFLETYIKLRGEKIKSTEDRPEDKITDRFDLSECLLINREIKSLFSLQKTFFERKNGKQIPKQVHSLATANYSLSWNTATLSLQLGNKKYDYSHHDGGQYFTGAWLEEYVFLKLTRVNQFDQVLANVKFDFTSFSLLNKKNPQDIFKNEMDVVVTKGLKAAFIECKAGQVKQDHVYKLQVLRDYFLGTFGMAVLVTKFPPQENIIEKCKDANIPLVTGDDIQNIDRIINELIF